MLYWNVPPTLQTHLYRSFLLILMLTVPSSLVAFERRRPSSFLSSSIGFRSALLYNGNGFKATASRYHSQAPGMFRSRGYSSKLFVVEHAVDCAQNPIIAQLYGANSEQCFNTGNHFLTNLGGALNEAITIGFFIVATILVNRSKNNLSGFSLDDYDGNQDI